MYILLHTQNTHLSLYVCLYLCVCVYGIGGLEFPFGFLKKKSLALWVCVCVCVCLCVLILIFRGALLSMPMCVNTPADQMADNDFQIDTLHSTSRENQWALIAFFPRRSSLPWKLLSIYLLLSLLLSQFLCLSSRPIHSPLNTTETESIHAAFHWGFAVKRYRNISLRRSSPLTLFVALLLFDLSDWRWACVLFHQCICCSDACH